jgi:hypothetical protein
MEEVNPLLTGQIIGEAPCWHANRLWFSDFSTREFGTVDLTGTRSE